MVERTPTGDVAPPEIPDRLSSGLAYLLNRTAVDLFRVSPLLPPSGRMDARNKSGHDDMRARREEVVSPAWRPLV